MNKIIKIALIASVIALLGCAADGDPNGPRIADATVNNPAGNNPRDGMDKLLNDAKNAGKASSYTYDDDDDYDYDNDYDYYYDYY